jgi:hypothetical protein
MYLDELKASEHNGTSCFISAEVSVVAKRSTVHLQPGCYELHN